MGSSWQLKVQLFHFCIDEHVALQSVGLCEVVLSISVVLHECCQGIVRLELLTLITSSWSCWLCMWPLYLSCWRVGDGRSTVQAVHMDSGRKR